VPKKVERKLKRQAAKKGLKPGTDRYGAYVYGTMNRLGLMRGNKVRRR